MGSMAQTGLILVPSDALGHTWALPGALGGGQGLPPPTGPRHLKKKTYASFATGGGALRRSQRGWSGALRGCGAEAGRAPPAASRCWPPRAAAIRRWSRHSSAAAPGSSLIVPGSSGGSRSSGGAGRAACSGACGVAPAGELAVLEGCPRLEPRDRLEHLSQLVHVVEGEAEVGLGRACAATSKGRGGWRGVLRRCCAGKARAGVGEKVVVAVELVHRPLHHPADLEHVAPLVKDRLMDARRPDLESDVAEARHLEIGDPAEDLLFEGDRGLAGLTRSRMASEVLSLGPERHL